MTSTLYEKSVYISNTDVETAKNDYFARIRKDIADSEVISIYESSGRITYKCVYAKISSPGYNAAAMDGIAVRAEDTYRASEVNPVILREGKDFEYVNTGAVLKELYNAVIMIEDVIELEVLEKHEGQGYGNIKIIAPAHPWQHVRPVGEDIVAGEMIIPSRHRIRPVDLGALISAGIEEIRVYKKPKIGVIPTGSELVGKYDDLKEGKIIESNSRVFEALIIEYGGVPNRYPPCEDDYDALKSAIASGIKENDILLVNAGSSAGSRDYTAEVIRELGEVVVHGVALKPGKPTILGLIGEKPVIGIPGYPVSSYLVFETFVKPLMLKYTGVREYNAQVEYNSQIIRAAVSKRVVSSFKNEELVRATLGYIGGRFIATPLTRGAGVTMSLVKADGIFSIPRNSEGVEAGEEVEVRLLRLADSIRGTLVSIGSHDIIIDEISDMMELSSGHTGSMGGITALKRGECHIAPIHLMDEDTGEYNLPYVRRYFKDMKMALIKGLKRLQGFIVQVGNPYNITDFKDLANKDIRYVNRQRGAGTRMLLDYNLKKIGLDPKSINGYEREMITHMAVAISVRTGSADAGLGVMSAAKSMGLGFIPVGYENYDFLSPYEYLEDSKVKRFIEVLKSDEFRKRVDFIGGYGLENVGEVIIIGD